MFANTKMRTNLMANEEKNNEKKKETTDKKILNNRLEELRSWFDAMSDCV